MSRPDLTRRTALSLLAALPALGLAQTGLAAGTRPAAWAVPLSLPGVPNLFRVTPTLYRSAQPLPEGFAALAGIGVKTVINLRRRIEDAPLAAGTGLTTLHIPITTRHITDDDAEAIVQALRAVRARQATGPVLVHCTHGADRTGLVIALWRILDQGWTRAEAHRELIDGGYGFHPVWINIPRFLDSVDLAALQSRVAAG